MSVPYSTILPATDPLANVSAARLSPFTVVDLLLPTLPIKSKRRRGGGRRRVKSFSIIPALFEEERKGGIGAYERAKQRKSNLQWDISRLSLSFCPSSRVRESQRRLSPSVFGMPPIAAIRKAVATSLTAVDLTAAWTVGEGVVAWAGRGKRVNNGRRW